jgi:trehalose 6-phosphate phosphatase
MNDPVEPAVSRLARAPELLVLCEFDGAIAEFVTDPASARPVADALETLISLGELAHTRAAVISGRSLESLRAVCAPIEIDADLCALEFIGSGGMEIESQMTLGLTAGARRLRVLLSQAAGQVADTHPGVMVDEKPFGVALHIRGAAPADGQHAMERLLDLAESLPQPVYSQARNEVLDVSVLPVGQDWAIDALREQQQATVFYAGNDERALAALGPTDVSCAVGVGCRGATLSVESPRELIQLLVGVRDERARLVGRPT